MTALCHNAGHPAREITVFNLMPGKCVRSCNRLMQPVTQICGVSLYTVMFQRRLTHDTRI